MKYKQWLAISLVLMAAAALLFGCRKAAPSSSADETSAGVTEYDDIIDNGDLNADRDVISTTALSATNTTASAADGSQAASSTHSSKPAASSQSKGGITASAGPASSTTSPAGPSATSATTSSATSATQTASTNLTVTEDTDNRYGPIK